MTNLFLLNEDVNVIVVDWGGGSSGLYSQTAANTRLVGLEVAALIDYLMVQCKKKEEVPLTTFHSIIGSLLLFFVSLGVQRRSTRRLPHHRALIGGSHCWICRGKAEGSTKKKAGTHYSPGSGSAFIPRNA